MRHRSGPLRPPLPRAAGSRRRRTVAAILAAGMLAACSGGDGPAAAPTTKPPTTTRPADATAPPADGASSPSTGAGAASGDAPVAWTACGGSFLCARLAVPLDHADPGGAQLHLSLLKRPARQPKQRIGSLVVNYGGPGVAGVDFLRDDWRSFPAAVRDRFDLVSFDPRGVGESGALDCGVDWSAVIPLDGDPDTPAEVSALTAAQEDEATRCAQTAGSLLPHLGTADVARDLDLIRAAVGDAKLTYLGYSYGSELGFAYATMFPDHVRAIVLDGAIDPALSYADILRSQADGLEHGIEAFWAECAARAHCGLGSDPEAATRAVLAGLESGATLPADVNGEHRQLHIGEAQYGILWGLYDEETGWPQLEEALVKAQQGDGGPLLQLADEATGYEGGGRYTATFDAFSAVTCADRVERPTVADAEAFAAQLAARDPFWGRWMAYGLSACHDWPLAADGYDHDGTAAGAPPILVIGGTGDPVTPYDQTASLADQLASGVLLTRVGQGHTSYGTGDCIDGAVDTYLVDLRPPAVGTRC